MESPRGGLHGSPAAASCRDTSPATRTEVASDGSRSGHLKRQGTAETADVDPRWSPLCGLSMLLARTLVRAATCRGTDATPSPLRALPPFVEKGRLLVRRGRRVPCIGTTGWLSGAYDLLSRAGTSLSVLGGVHSRPGVTQGGGGAVPVLVGAVRGGVSRGGCAVSTTHSARCSPVPD
jgi:hypothetical protein